MHDKLHEQQLLQEIKSNFFEDIAMRIAYCIRLLASERDLPCLAVMIDIRHQQWDACKE